MSDKASIHNQQQNEAHYDNVYSTVDVQRIAAIAKDTGPFLDNAIKTYTSWHGLYMHDLRQKVVGKKVLELGCGDGLNAAVLAALGAEVTANDISAQSGYIIDALNAQCNFKHPIRFVAGSFLNAVVPARTYDYVLGKAFLHHLTPELETAFLEKIATIVKDNGEVRFFEPAVNSKWLDNLRWIVPVPGRPSKFQKAKFEKYLEADPHPVRDNSSAHYIKAGLSFFEEAKVYPVGAIERLHRFLPAGNFNKQFRRWAFRAERLMPKSFRSVFARSQLIVYRRAHIN